MTDLGPLQGTARPLDFVQPCLGSGDYNVVIGHRQSKLGPARPWRDWPFKSGDWGRALNRSSACSSQANESDCLDFVNEIRPWRHEMWIYRDDDRIVRAPIVNVTPDEEAGTITLSGRDMGGWFDVRQFFHTMTPKGIDLAYIFAGYVGYLLRGEMPEWGRIEAGDPPVYSDDPGLEWEVTPTGILGDRTIYRTDYKTGSSELEELSRTGVDWTIIDSQMWVGGVEVAAPGGDGSPLALPGRITDEFFATPPRVRRTGEGMANQVAVRGNEERLVRGGPDPVDGVLLQRVLDEYSIEDTASAEALAEGYLARGEVESTYAEGDSNLAASAPIDLRTMIPGTRVLVDLGRTLQFNGWLRLDTVTGQFGAGDQGEVIRPTLQPLGTNADARGAGG